ncbi:hypothetical protein [Lentzea albidocapillata]|uniref:Uncharacterized protein n=1 Tax=Lentzea albidocapillata TaxID=40571 RepID=A0A1W2FQW9_9PSEU|nr:hypothetical protein [Lentzea albidocapillata]SMD24112.1 hypothetical protein SAMN05660733_07585 [Lentzea albidocapillata]
MTLVNKALALYHRTRAQYLQLTSPSRFPADHNHLARPLAVTFPLHRSPTSPRRRRRPLNTALRHLLAASFPPRPAPLVPLVAPAAAAPHVVQRQCRMCAATVQQP